MSWDLFVQQQNTVQIYSHGGSEVFSITIK